MEQGSIEDEITFTIFFYNFSIGFRLLDQPLTSRLCVVHQPIPDILTK